MSTAQSLVDVIVKMVKRELNGLRPEGLLWELATERDRLNHRIVYESLT